MTAVLRRSLVAFATALALVAIAAVSGMGSATFSAAVDLSAPGQKASEPQVAVGPDGATTITWRRSNGTNNIIQAATRPAGSATFSAAVDLSAPSRDAFDPQVAVGPDGATTITWTRSDGIWPNSIIQASSRGLAPAFTVLSVKAGASALRSRVTLPGPGVLSQSARSTGSKRVRVCAARKKVSRASTVWIVCPLTRATKRALLHRSLRVRVITTFTPTGGVAQVRTKIIRLGARRATTAGTG